MNRILPFLFTLGLLVSCNNKNKLSNDEQKLTAEIKKEEQENQETKSITDNQFQPVKDTFSYDLRYAPKRIIDLQNPPEIIDIAGNLENIKEFKLSDIAKSITYIRLQQTIDSTFLGQVNNDFHLVNAEEPLKEEIPLSIIKNNQYIVAYNQLGMLLYNSKGELLKTICSNEFTGFSLSKTGVAGGSSSTFKGANGKPRLIGNKLYYNYEDDVDKIARMMEVDCENLPLLLPVKSENLKQIIGLGTPVALTGENSYSAIALGSGIYSKAGHPKRNEDMFTIYNSTGDTLCSFSGNQKILNYTSTVARTPDWGTRFTYKDFFYFREAHSDTIFKVVPPNHLIPAFIINFGKYKVDKIQNAMSPSYDLSDKFLPQTFVVTDDFVFIFYTQGYNSPNNRREKKVKFFHAIYNRKTKELWHVKSAPDDNEFALENNLDGGLPVWPGDFSFKYYAPTSISEEGEIIQSVKGEVLIEYIHSEEFKNSSAPKSKKQEFIEFVNSVGKYETIVAVIK